MKISTIIKSILIIAMGSILSCSKSPDTDKEESSASQQSEWFDYATYEGPGKRSTINEKFQTECKESFCVIEESTSNLPIRKHDGTSICVLAQYERKAIMTVYFDSEDRFAGASCEISKSDYEEISNHYGLNKTYNKYANQNNVHEDFMNWMTVEGFITTYKDLIGRNEQGEIAYSYFVYVGIEQHPYYSKYRKK